MDGLVVGVDLMVCPDNSIVMTVTDNKGEHVPTT